MLDHLLGDVLTELVEPKTSPHRAVFSRSDLEAGVTIDEAAFGGGFGAILGGAVALLAGALLGALAAQVGKLAHPEIELPAGCAGAALAGIGPRVLFRCIRPFRWTLAGLALAFLSSVGLLLWAGLRLDGLFFPWALAATPWGIWSGAVGYSRYLIQGGADIRRAKQDARFVTALFLVCAFPFKLLGDGRLGTCLAGAVCAAIGSLPTVAVLAIRGRGEIASVFGSSWTLIAGGALIGALAGVVGGWTIWNHRVQDLARTSEGSNMERSEMRAG